MLLAATLLMTSVALPAQQAAAPPAPATLPPARLPGTPTGQAPAAPPAHTVGPDEDLLDFLGSDDTGDVAWWEFLKRAPQRVRPPVTPPQDAKP